MKIININKNINEIKSDKFVSLRCTLLVPKYYLNKLYKIRIKNKLSFEKLLSKYLQMIQKENIKIQSNQSKHTTLYQYKVDSDLDLIRCHFRCDPMIWHHWKRLANHYGISMCLLFKICLKETGVKDPKFVGTTAKSGRFHKFIFFEFTNFSKYFSNRWLYTRFIY